MLYNPNWLLELGFWILSMFDIMACRADISEFGGGTRKKSMALGPLGTQSLGTQSKHRCGEVVVGEGGSNFDCVQRQFKTDYLIIFILHIWKFIPDV